MKKQIQDNVSQVVDKIISEMPFEKRVSHAKIKNEDVEVPKVSLTCISKARLMSMIRNTPIEDSEIK